MNARTPDHKVARDWTLINLLMHPGKLRTADCVAKGHVEVVVMSKRDFQDLDNPLLAWMIDYDAVATVLRVRFLAHQIGSCWLLLRWLSLQCTRSCSYLSAALLAALNYR